VAKLDGLRPIADDSVVQPDLPNSGHSADRMSTLQTEEFKLLWPRRAMRGLEMASGDELWKKQKADSERQEKYKGLRKRNYAKAARGAARDAYIHYAERREELAGTPPLTGAPSSSPSPPASLIERRAQLEAQIVETSSPISRKVLLHALQQVDLNAADAAAQLEFVASTIASTR
jgi:transcriptional regulator with GAF, ATPase, and Fis domain